MCNMTDTTDTPDILRHAPAGRLTLWVGEVATLAGVTPMSVHRWAKSGRLPVDSTTAGGNRRYSFKAVAELLASLGRPVPWWLHGAAVAVARGANSVEDLGQLVTDLATLEDWLRQDYLDPHAEEGAEVARRARRIVEDLADAIGGAT